ncbi:MAG: GatB/YqeY domain-containing protein [Candidatus Paceibacterota bacterium]|jgi:hypothetical protein
MALKQRIESDLKTALLNKDRFTTEVLRGLKAVILNEEIALGKRDEGLDNSAIEQLIVKEIKKRHDSVALYEQGGRQELADSEQKEAEFLRGYIPKQLTEAELTDIIKQAIVKLDAHDGARSIGQVIGMVKKQVSSQADGATIARIVQQVLK